MIRSVRGFPGAPDCSRQTSSASQGARCPTRCWPASAYRGAGCSREGPHARQHPAFDRGVRGCCFGSAWAYAAADRNDRNVVNDVGAELLEPPPVLAAAPAPAPVARLVRSSHERWDGGATRTGLPARRSRSAPGSCPSATASTRWSATADHAGPSAPHEALVELERNARQASSTRT